MKKMIINMPEVASGKLVQLALSFPKEEETRVSLSIAETIKPVLVILAYK